MRGWVIIMGKKVVIIGGVAGGASAAARLRRLDEQAEIIMMEKGEYISFANCGLPYYIGGEITEKSALTLQTPNSFHARFNVDVRINNEVVAIDKEAKKVKVKKTDTGEVYEESYDKLILSPGAEPIRPTVNGFDNPKVFTLRNIPDTYKIKDYTKKANVHSAIVVGGGYIGIEMAENLFRAGLDVTIVEGADHIIAPLDAEMACDVQNHIRDKGIELILNDKVLSIEDSGEGLNVKLASGDRYADMVILSIGVRPESKIAKEAGLAVNDRGAVLVNENMLTSDENIYAAGDVVAIQDFVTGGEGYIPLAGPANKQGRIVADNITGIKSVYKGTQGTGVLKAFDMTVATTGIKEEAAKKSGLDYEKSYTYSASHATYYPGAVNMSVKLIFEKGSGKIIGAQIVGYDGVEKRLDVIATAMRAGMTIFDLTELELSYAPPFSSAKDPVNMAGFVAENIMTGKTKVFHWNEVDKLPRDGSVNLLDIRTRMEYDNGTLDGFMNIPVDELRQNLDRLDKTKPVYVTCQIGLRGHVACRILSQNGFDCYNLSGGYRLYASIKRSKDYKPGQFVKKIDNNIGNIETFGPSDEQKEKEIPDAGKKLIKVNACGLQCPGPIMKLADAMAQADSGDVVEIETTDPAFGCDVEAWCRRTGNTFQGIESSKGMSKATIQKGGTCPVSSPCAGNAKNLIVFSQDLDKAIAAFIIANGAASMGRKVSMFFTFWGLNILRKHEAVPVRKDPVSSMFGAMMPRGSKKLPISNMNMGGMGAKMIRAVMNNKNIDSLESLIEASLKNGVELVACSMSMDVMGIKKEELIDGVKLGGVAAMLGNAEESDMSLFI